MEALLPTTTRTEEEIAWLWQQRLATGNGYIVDAMGSYLDPALVLSPASAAWVGSLEKRPNC